jgi:hypothetical protein
MSHRRSARPSPVALALALTWGALALLLVTVQPVDARKKLEVEWRQSETARVSALRTYSWQRGESLPDEGPLSADEPADRTIRRSGDRALARKGYEPAEDGAEPDFVIVYHVIPKDRQYVEGEGYKVGRWVRLGTTETTIRSFMEGTLLLDLVDANTEELIWTGWVSALARDPEDLKRVAGRAVRAILEELPPAKEDVNGP